MAVDSPKVWDEDAHAFVHGAAVADVPTGISAAADANAGAINAILAALRSAGIIAAD